MGFPYRENDGLETRVLWPRDERGEVSALATAMWGAHAASQVGRVSGGGAERAARARLLRAAAVLAGGDEELKFDGPSIAIPVLSRESNRNRTDF